MAGAVKAIAAHAVLAVQHLRQGIAVGVFRQALVERSVEHRDLRQFGKQAQGRFDTQQIGRIMQGRQRRGAADRRQAGAVDTAGLGKVFAAMHHPVANAVQAAVGSLFDPWQQLRQGAPMIGAGHVQAVFLAALLPVQHGVRRAQALGQAAEGKVAVGWIQQGKLDG